MLVVKATCHGQVTDVPGQNDLSPPWRRPHSHHYHDQGPGSCPPRQVSGLLSASTTFGPERPAEQYHEYTRAGTPPCPAAPRPRPSRPFRRRLFPRSTATPHGVSREGFVCVRRGVDTRSSCSEQISPFQERLRAGRGCRESNFPVRVRVGGRCPSTFSSLLCPRDRAAPSGRDVAGESASRPRRCGRGEGRSVTSSSRRGRRK